VIYKRILGENLEFLGTKCGRPATVFGRRSAPEANSTWSFPVAFYPLRTHCSYAWNGKNSEEKEWFSPFKIPRLTSFLTSVPKLSSSPLMPWILNALSTAVVVRMIPLLREAPHAKVTSCTLVTSTDMEKALDTMNEVTRGAGAPSAMMGGRPA
jgi:hypothetical protein